MYQDEGSWNQWLVFLLPPLFFLTLVKDIGRLAIFSLFAQISNLFAFGVVYWFDFQHLHLAQVHPKVSGNVQYFFDYSYRIFFK